MTDRQDISRLDDFLDGELSPADEAEFMANLCSSPKLKAELAVAKRLKNLMERLPTPTPSSTYFQEVTDIILARAAGAESEQAEPERKPAPPPETNWVNISLQVAASLALFFAALSLSQSKQNQSAVVMPLSEYRTLAARADSDAAQSGWEISHAELSEVAIGITAVSTPGRASGFSTLADVIAVRYQ